MWKYFIVFSIFHCIVTNGQNGTEFTSAVLVRKRPTNNLNFGGSRYYFQTVFKANYFGAWQYCKQQNMELVSIETQAENDRIGLFLVENGLTYAHFWTSASKHADNNRWVWLATGRDIVYTNWYWTEPNNLPFLAENCIEARHEGTSGFTWNDLNCMNQLFFICETSLQCRC
ncbi:C-type lectin mosGCTL-1 [Leptinotarsa decemlineata]|uniref:C-type lectin mosGCTL-1 n=1 Tax=Leptinotarsa decemlineata TaxID=7539 RepID=UPI003D30BE6A